MRNAFVVLVSLCIGVASGLIVPPGDSKSSPMANVKQDKDEFKSTTELLHISVLSDNRSDEKALYEHASDKENVQNQRAFIYINQKYKKPSLHQYFRLAQNGPDLTRSFHLPPPIPQAALQRLNDPYERKIDMRKHYGFSPPYRTKDAKGLLHKARDPNFEGDFVNDDIDASRVFEKADDGDKSLEKYLKDALEDQSWKSERKPKADM
ncbi:uncharacterized protein LOC142981092 isoform X2 [Anticarsia gemmatalis]|uniref:uncharacterized protein LOC142981092 isoform X2 n=1 Tax=Anticarsia gemmatalis TaxID=129554 RepID=UPI003F75C5E2